MPPDVLCAAHLLTGISGSCLDTKGSASGQWLLFHSVNAVCKTLRLGPLKVDSGVGGRIDK